ncbi:MULTISPECIES: hypothetical protein [Myroides]|uniref:Uncharacterized protein n=1 Tax=Myroides albus TaxID=2562892 RepID=A0A6I3LFF5_9FLAO|nr:MULTISPECIES: hypothetical protein [Myroides]MTG96637.1 hypothetical protein [Myroides albus]MVX35268.1 hypothetical protein [Myroides sp. LoEW2-1]UVD80950.1 hypothetical protein NWE55_06815 [Myroides albus]
MNNNLKLLVVGLIVFAVALILKTQRLLSDNLSTIVIIAALVITIIPLYKLVFKKLKK